MDKLIINKFNDGINDGDITIISADKEIIKCHSFVIVNVSGYFKSLYNFNTSKELKEFKLGYNIKLVKLIINMMYNSNYQYEKTIKLSLDEVIHLIKLIDELLIEIDIDKFKKQFLLDFRKNINLENCVEILIQLYEFDIYKSLIKYIIDYICYQIYENDNIMIINKIYEISEHFNSDLQKQLICNILTGLNKKNIENLNNISKFVKNQCDGQDEDEDVEIWYDSEKNTSTRFSPKGKKTSKKSSNKY